MSEGIARGVESDADRGHPFAVRYRNPSVVAEEVALTGRQFPECCRNHYLDSFTAGALLTWLSRIARAHWQRATNARDSCAAGVPRSVGLTVATCCATICADCSARRAVRRVAIGASQYSFCRQADSSARQNRSADAFFLKCIKNIRNVEAMLDVYCEVSAVDDAWALYVLRGASGTGVIPIVAYVGDRKTCLDLSLLAFDLASLCSSTSEFVCHFLDAVAADPGRDNNWDFDDGPASSVRCRKPIEQDC